MGQPIRYGSKYSMPKPASANAVTLHSTSFIHRVVPGAGQAPFSAHALFGAK